MSEIFSARSIESAVKPRLQLLATVLALALFGVSGFTVAATLFHGPPPGIPPAASLTPAPTAPVEEVQP
jgi:hypothetical protein